MVVATLMKVTLSVYFYGSCFSTSETASSNMVASARTVLLQKLHNISILNNCSQVFHVWPIVTNQHEYQINIEANVTQFKKDASCGVQPSHCGERLTVYIANSCKAILQFKNKQQPFKLYVLGDKSDKQDIISPVLKITAERWQVFISVPESFTIYFNRFSWMITWSETIKPYRF